MLGHLFDLEAKPGDQLVDIRNHRRQLPNSVALLTAAVGTMAKQPVRLVRTVIRSVRSAGKFLTDLGVPNDETHEDLPSSLPFTAPTYAF